MATRCTIKITGPDKLITLYRHWDGYPAETGRDLARRLRGQIGGTAADLAGRLLEDPAYELTETEDRHGDTEWRYRIWLFPSEGPGFQALNRRPGEDEWHAKIGGGAAAFRGYIASETRALRRRIRAIVAARAEA